MKPVKRKNDCTSSSEGESTSKKLKTSLKKTKKLRKRRDSTSSSSGTSSSSSSSSENENIQLKKCKKSKNYKNKYKTKARKHSKSKKSKKKKAHKHKKTAKPSKEEKNTKNEKITKIKNEEVSNDIPIDLMDKSMTPMTKEQWEKQQSIVRKVYDESTGRYRLIKGDGEVIEEIVSRDRHKQINQQATRGDGEFFQSNLKHLNH